MARTVHVATDAEAIRHQRRSLRALGGVAAQGSQALASLVLQVLAARLLGVEGLGMFAAVYAFIVMATAVTSGFVGDSLTVLDRRRPAIRSALQKYWIGLSVGLGGLVCAGTWLSGLLDAATAVACGLATATFLFEDVVRRLLMASLTFWRIVAVDLVVLLSSVGWIVLVHWRTGEVTLTGLLLGMAFGQTLGAVVGLRLLPAAERHLGPWRGADWKAVVSYGSWRALQQVVRPSMLAGVRVACVTIASLAAAGELEAARIYMAPAMIVVTGVSSVLFAGYAIDRAMPLGQQLRKVDRTVLLLVTAISVLCGAALLVQPWLAPLLTDGEYELSTVAVAGWAAFAAATAMSTPYGQLAGVRGQHVGVLVIRVVDSCVALTLVVALLATGMDVALVPVGLAMTTLGGGIAMRWLVARAAARTV